MYEQTRQQFGKAADAYSQSTMFSQGQDLTWLVEAAAPQPYEKALDIGTAAGHTAFALAPFVATVVGLDITPEMIELARTNALQRGIGNFVGVVANAENLPFADATLDIVACRYTAHHFHQPCRVIEEVARVLRPSGRLVVIDNTAPDQTEADKWINTVDQLRDPSHVRQWNLSEWERMITKAGMIFSVIRTWQLPLEFGDWTARQQTPPARVVKLSEMFAGASSIVREAFAIDGPHFALLTRLMRGVKL